MYIAVQQVSVNKWINTESNKTEYTKLHAMQYD